MTIFTRYDPSAPDDDDEKSVLDIIIVSKNLVEFLDKV